MATAQQVFDEALARYPTLRVVYRKYEGQNETYSGQPFNSVAIQHRQDGDVIAVSDAGETGATDCKLGESYAGELTQPNVMDFFKRK